jgi:hypothetical protein
VTMTLAPSSLYPAPPHPPLRPQDAHWLGVLHDNLDLIHRELRTERLTRHPGGRHRIAKLEALAARLAEQIEMLERRS